MSDQTIAAVRYCFGVAVGAFIVIGMRDLLHFNLQWWGLLLYVPVLVGVEVAEHYIGIAWRRRRVRKAVPR